MRKFCGHYWGSPPDYYGISPTLLTGIPHTTMGHPPHYYGTSPTLLWVIPQMSMGHPPDYPPAILFYSSY